MLAWLFRRHPHLSSVEARFIIRHLLLTEERLDQVINDLTKLQAAVTALEAAIPTLDQQPAIDALTTRVEAVTAAVVPPAVP